MFVVPVLYVALSITQSNAHVRTHTLETHYYHAPKHHSSAVKLAVKNAMKRDTAPNHAEPTTIAIAEKNVSEVNAELVAPAQEVVHR